MYNGGKDGMGDWSSYGSQSLHVKIARASQSRNVIRKGKALLYYKIVLFTDDTSKFQGWQVFPERR